MRSNSFISIYDPYTINSGEYIEWKLLTDGSGNLTLNTDGYGFNGEPAGYSWLVYVNGDYVGHFVGYSTPNCNTNGGSTPDLVSYITIATGLSSNTEYNVRIIPYKTVYGWARALSSPFDKLTQIVKDDTYMGFGKSATDTGHYFRYGQYYCCSRLTTPVAEVLPNTVTTIGNNFRAYQYAFKVWIGSYGRLNYSPNEVMPNSVINIGDNFRTRQYCHTNIVICGSEAFSNSALTVGNGFRYYQYRDTLVVNAPDEAFSNSVTSVGSLFRAGQYYSCGKMEMTGVEQFSTNLTSIGSQLRNRQYAYCGLLDTVTGISAITNNISLSLPRNQQFKGSGNTTTPIVMYINGDKLDCYASSNLAYNSMGLSNNNVYRIIVNSNLVTTYQNSDKRSEIDDWKFGDTLDDYVFATDNNLQLISEQGDNIALEISDTYYH